MSTIQVPPRGTDGTGTGADGYPREGDAGVAGEPGAVERRAARADRPGGRRLGPQVVGAVDAGPQVFGRSDAGQVANSSMRWDWSL